MTPFADLELGDAAQRHVLADGGDELLQAILDGRLRAREVRRLERLDRAVAHERDLGGLAREGLELVVAGDEVGLGVDLDDRRACGPTDSTATRPSAATRPAFLAALARPFLRSQSTAASTSPSVSLSAALQSIMPAPVFSRSSFTIAAVIFAMAVPFRSRMRERRRSRRAPGRQSRCRQRAVPATAPDAPSSGGVDASRGPGRPSRHARCGR